MKRIIIYLLISAFAVGFSSCSDDDPSKTSIFPTDPPLRNELDNWLLKNFTTPYNIDLKYRMEDIEADTKYDLVPAKYSKSIELANLIKYLWLDVYDEVAGEDFTRTYIPKVLFFIGSAGYNPNGTMVLGTAEGGLKITLYAVNDLRPTDIKFLTTYYFHTMHHEFAHIFHQTKKYSDNFEDITRDKYVANEWSNETYTGKGLENGFITDYARYGVDEDFVEIYATYITMSKVEWANTLDRAGKPGKSIIEEKLSYVKDYMLTSWNIDMDILRDVVLRRNADVLELDLSALN